MKIRIKMAILMSLLLLFRVNLLESQPTAKKIHKYKENRNNKEIVEIIRINSDYFESSKISLIPLKINSDIETEKTEQLRENTFQRYAFPENIKEEVDSKDFLSLSIFDIMGNRVLLFGYSDNNCHESVFNNLANGIYFIIVTRTSGSYIYKYIKN